MFINQTELSSNLNEINQKYEKRVSFEFKYNRQTNYEFKSAIKIGKQYIVGGMHEYVRHLDHRVGSIDLQGLRASWAENCTLETRNGP